MPKVLLVEDHPINRKLFRDLLQIHFEVLEADTAAAARVILSSASPDLILMDIQLPDQDGLALTRAVKADVRYTGIPIVALSAHASETDIAAARAAGCCDYITKPITDDPFVFLDRLLRIAQPHCAVRTPV
jgi:two-component system, cell cycle response regulator DivK